MILGLLVLALALLYLPANAHRFGRRLPAREWARTVNIALFAGAATLNLSLLSLATPSVLRFFGAAELARLCDEFLGHLPHGAPLVGWGALGLMLMMGGLAGAGAARTRSQLAALEIEPCLGQHIPHVDFDVVVLPSSEPVAYSRAGARRQIVVSEEVVEALTDGQFEMLLRHEMSHLDEGHERILRRLSALRHSLRWMPGFSRSIQAATLAIERVADEAAAGSDKVRRGALADALLATSRLGVCDAATAFNSVDGIRERIDAMSEGLAPLTRSERAVVRGSIAVLRTTIIGGGAAGALLLTVCIG